LIGLSASKTFLLSSHTTVDGRLIREHQVFICGCVQPLAFECWQWTADDLRGLLLLRKANLARLLARRPEGIVLSDFEQGEIGSDLFWAACRMGLQGLVSKHRDRPYRGGRSKHWIKVIEMANRPLKMIRGESGSNTNTGCVAG
jgi:ATP-dependent DNA ligase